MKKLIIPILLFCIGYASQLKAEETDLSTIDNVIYLPSQIAERGQTVTLSICMKNTAAIRGFQFDLYLPNGVTAKKTNKGKYVCSLNAERLESDDEHTLTVAEQADGAIRFLCGSLYDETFTGSDGEIVTLTVSIADDMELGDYPLTLKNMMLTETDISKYYEIEIVETTITVTESHILVEIEEVRNNSASEPYYDLQGRRVDNLHPTAQKPQLKKGVYIQAGKKVVIR